MPPRSGCTRVQRMPPEVPPRVILVGDGTAALLAAAALARMLPPGHLIWLAPLTPPAPIDHCARLWPVAEAFHARIGLRPEALAAAGAHRHSGERFERWPGPTPWDLPADAELIEQPQLDAWLADRRRPLAPAPDPAAPPTRIDPDAYARLLGAHVARLGVERRAVPHLGIERRSDGGIARLVADGHGVEADWVVDVSAGLSPAPLRPAPTATGLIAIGTAPREPQTRLRAAAFGWIGGGMAGFAPGTDPAAARRRFRTEAAVEPRAIAPVAQGRRTGWAANVVSLGPAAFVPDPVARLDLALVQSGLLRLSTMLPAGAPLGVEIAEANRRGESEHDAAADYARALTTIDREGAFWTAAAALPVSPMLARRLDLFARRGRLPPVEDDPVPPGQWRAVLAGLGHAPARPDPLARAGLAA
ncbi:tryptophan 7-halogenase [Sphingomonas spermidinifaciens]|nr:tryptophan 7-halogenase [Sphingomonas spermidinifaciens]